MLFHANCKINTNLINFNLLFKYFLNLIVNVIAIINVIFDHLMVVQFKKGFNVFFNYSSFYYLQIENYFQRYVYINY